MPIAAVLLILGSSVLHAAWNVLLKRADNKLAFTALYVSIQPLYMLPYVVAVSPWTGIGLNGWLCILAAGLVYAVYYEALARGYARGELSVVYPVARGIGPALAFLLGIAFLAESPSLLGTVGVAFILLGVYALHRRALRIELHKPGAAAGLRIAILVGVTYSVYSLVDKTGVSVLGIHPVLYYCLASLAAALFVAPRVLSVAGRSAVADEWRRNRAVCVAVAGLNLASYLLVLYALTMPDTPIGYVVPLRATSGLIAVFVGAGILQEGDLGAKLAAACSMLCGIVLISVKG